ncbi:MAG: prolipoprotein diacylglyceryl transferase [Lysobacteraceae bacterium]|nr:MAG: prolipoprotein diacylglyceryl transferase [Xanthomonadaceae bacterium]
MSYLHQIDPIAVQFPEFSLFGGNFHPAIHWYGLMYICGFVAAWFLGRRRVRAGRLPGVDEQAYGDLMFYCMLGVIFGARIGYVLFYDLSSYLDQPMQIFRIWEGGMSFHGGLLGVLVAALWWARKHRLHFFDVVDFVAPLVPPGLGFGRLGNFINGELWGKYTEAGWGVIFPHAEPKLAPFDAATLQSMQTSGMLDAYARHPSQLYQMSLEGIVLFSVLWWYSRKPRPRYATAGVFALLYGCFRFAVEFVRLPDRQIGYLAFDWLTMGQALSLPLVLLGLCLLWLSRKAPTLQPAPAVAPERG